MFAFYLKWAMNNYNESRLTVILTSHLVSVLAGIKHLAEITDGVIDERITTVFYARRKAALDTWNEESALWYESRFAISFKYSSLTIVFLTFTHRWKLVVETSVEASADRWSGQKTTHVTTVFHGRPNFVYVAGSLDSRRSGYYHRRIRWLFGSAACLWFWKSKIIIIIFDSTKRKDSHEVMK